MAIVIANGDLGGKWRGERQRSGEVGDIYSCRQKKKKRERAGERRGGWSSSTKWGGIAPKVGWEETRRGISPVACGYLNEGNKEMFLTFLRQDQF